MKEAGCGALAGQRPDPQTPQGLEESLGRVLWHASLFMDTATVYVLRLQAQGVPSLPTNDHALCPALIP